MPSCAGRSPDSCGAGTESTSIQIPRSSSSWAARRIALPLSLVQEGDNVLVPDIGYPVYTQSAILTGAEPRLFNLAVDRAFLPDPAQLAALADARTRLCWINYPNNPTGAEAGAGVFEPLAKLSPATAASCWPTMRPTSRSASTSTGR
ncbi:MAG: aminotransferase class I/II-fold pyridoxal phosphate-dependent enzyme [Candidatus Krumholzibacteriia bacterium]